MKHTFYTLKKAVEVDRFMQAPDLGEGMAWVSIGPGEWVEMTSPFSNLYQEDKLHLFGEPYDEFLLRQYRRQ